MSTVAVAPRRRRPVRKFLTRAAKRLVPLSLAVYFLPHTLLFYLTCGLIDVLRNQHRTPETLDRYFAGNGVLTWLMSPFNLLLDLLSLPYLNRGVYKLHELPQECQDEIASLIEAAHASDLVARVGAKLGDAKRGMVFWKWYGQNVDASVEVPEYHRPYRYVQTIGLSVFNKKASTGKHFGPLRLTLRVLYNINDITDPNVYIKVGGRAHRWKDDKLFIFDDTLQHQSCNESDGVRYCLFVDVLRPGLLPAVQRALLAAVRFTMARFNYVFFKHWVFLR
jgi:aspartyl/asparaginyl beta-hydroxylase (cupin superfamily)